MTSCHKKCIFLLLLLALLVTGNGSKWVDHTIPQNFQPKFTGKLVIPCCSTIKQADDEKLILCKTEKGSRFICPIPAEHFVSYQYTGIPETDNPVQLYNQVSRWSKVHSCVWQRKGQGVWARSDQNILFPTANCSALRLGQLPVRLLERSPTTRSQMNKKTLVQIGSYACWDQKHSEGKRETWKRHTHRETEREKQKPNNKHIQRPN